MYENTIKHFIPDVIALPAGVYFVRVGTAMQKFVKQ